METASASPPSPAPEAVLPTVTLMAPALVRLAVTVSLPVPLAWVPCAISSAAVLRASALPAGLIAVDEAVMLIALPAALVMVTLETSSPQPLACPRCEITPCSLRIGLSPPKFW